MVTVAKFFKVEDAYLFRSYLEAREIEAHVFDEHVSQLFWNHIQAFGGVRVVVADEDYEKAEELYVEYNDSMKSAPNFERPVRAWPIMVLASLFMGVPLMLFGRKSKADDTMTINPRHELLALTLRVLMGVWFVYAGGMKIFVAGLDKFVTDIENYRLAFGSFTISGNVAVAVAYLVPWLEVVAGMSFMLGFLRKGTWWVMLGLVLAFVFAVGSAWSRGLDITCGCFGGMEKISYWRKAAEFTIYLAALAWIGWVEWKTSKHIEE